MLCEIVHAPLPVEVFYRYSSFIQLPCRNTYTIADKYCLHSIFCDLISLQKQNIQFSKMQKHNEWLSNMGYLRHLEVLNKINNRKVHSSLNKTCSLRHRNDRTTILNESKEHKTQEEPLETTFVRTKENAPIRDQQILWDNYYLGKRIIETPPVISKKKLDEEYKRHRQIIDSMTASTSRKAMPTQFRVKKLQEYKENVEQRNEDLALQNAVHKHFIKIKINSLAFYREKHSFDNIDLLFVYANKNGKKHKQTCEGFPASEILEKHFYFGISKRLTVNQEALLLEFRNLKGLSVFSIGYISFPSVIALANYKAQLFHCGRPIGEVEISTSFNSKDSGLRIEAL